MAEEFPGWSPYAYVHNNPLRYTDPTGMGAEGVTDDYYNENGEYLYTDTRTSDDIRIISQEDFDELTSRFGTQDWFSIPPEQIKMTINGTE